jgi:hypothetical protein
MFATDFIFLSLQMLPELVGLRPWNVFTLLRVRIMEKEMQFLSDNSFFALSFVSFFRTRLFGSRRMAKWFC